MLTLPVHHRDALSWGDVYRYLWLDLLKLIKLTLSFQEIMTPLTRCDTHPCFLHQESSVLASALWFQAQIEANHGRGKYSLQRIWNQGGANWNLRLCPALAATSLRLKSLENSKAEIRKTTQNENFPNQHPFIPWPKYPKTSRINIRSNHYSNIYNGLISRNVSWPPLVKRMTCVQSMFLRKRAHLGLMPHRSPKGLQAVFAAIHHG